MGSGSRCSAWKLLESRGDARQILTRHDIIANASSARWVGLALFGVAAARGGGGDWRRAAAVACAGVAYNHPLDTLVTLPLIEQRMLAKPARAALYRDYMVRTTKGSFCKKFLLVRFCGAERPFGHASRRRPRGGGGVG